MPEAIRPRLSHPARSFALLLAGALALLVALVSHAAARPLPAWPPPQRLAPADTDSVAVDRQALEAAPSDTTRSDSLAQADSLASPDSLRLVNRYLSSLRRGGAPGASLFARSTLPLSPRLGSYWQHELQLDSTGNYFIAREIVGSEDVRYPITVDFDTYRRARLKQDLSTNWEELATQLARQRQSQRGGLGFNIVVPGGRQSAFTSIFGKPEVDLRVTGAADIRAGFDYRKSDQNASFTGRAAQVDPDFKQDLRLGITGSIGDKMRVDVNWDTQNQFDYQNQLKLQYTGYEDEIIQSVEAGNVFLNTPSTLIRGGQSLFGIKSEFQLGGVRLTTVASQQEGQANSLAISGGSETASFELKPTDYEDNTHYFLGYYFRNRWEDAHDQPPNFLVANGFETILDIEVWKATLRQGVEDENVRQVVAMVDLGEEPVILNQGLNDPYLRAVLPSPLLDQYDDAETEDNLRDGNAQPESYLRGAQMELPLSASDYSTGPFQLLVRGVDYQVNEALGYLSLTQRLQENEAIAVAFRYRANGQTIAVGDFSTESGGTSGGQNADRLVLKLLRPKDLLPPGPNANPAAWYLEMRNIYGLVRGLSPNDFDLQIYYEAPGKPTSKTLPGVGGRQTLLQLLRLDRLNADGAPPPDDNFDYLNGYTLDAQSGLLIFPDLEPFGRRIAEAIEASGGAPETQQQYRDLYVFSSLYQLKKANAQRETQYNDIYRIRGSSRGAVQDFYDLRAFAGLIEGSVRVTSGGTPLQEGADFVVDYQGGTVTITNPAYLSSGREINITYEQNSFFNLQKKTLLGALAEYNLEDRMSVWSTIFRLNEKSPIDKFRIGEEPISNTTWGLGGQMNLEPRWLTRAVDALPFIQTRAPSSVVLSGEFAQLLPGHGETVAFRRTRDNLKDAGRDFSSDELSGISFIDDFEGFENTYSLKQPGAWRLSAPPDSLGAVDALGPQAGSFYDSLRTTWRGGFAWYQLNNNIVKDLAPISTLYDARAGNIIQINDVYPNRDVSQEVDRSLPVLDLYFSPHERGPYNYTTELNTFLANPQNAWGGMTQRLPEGFNDFSLKNIDFVEFIVQILPENQQVDAGRDARLYLDLGSISEDVLPDERLNNEDGLSTTTVSPSSLNKWSRLTTGTQNNAINVDDATNRTEDLGLDGLASYPGSEAAYDSLAIESFHFSDFLNTLPACADERCRQEVAKARRDPSGDDYYYFGETSYFNNAEFFPNGTPALQQRFMRYFAASELNAFETQNTFSASDLKRGNSRFPDSEDLDLDNNANTNNSYFQYELPLSKAVLDSMAVPERVDDYVVGKIETSRDGINQTWYQVRIPVRNFTRRVGGIQDFTLIKYMRLWTTGHSVPVTMRLATLELVGSQWQKSDAIAREREFSLDPNTRSSISSINSEEDRIYATPTGAIISQNRLATGGTQLAREQAMIFRVEGLPPGKQRAIYKTFNQGLDLLKYSNLRMFTHLHGTTRAGSLVELPEEVAREKVRLFVRLGANETSDYYEYEQPLTPSSETSGSPDELWQTFQQFNGQTIDLNSVNIDLGAFNQLKVARDQRAGFPTDSVFWNVLDGQPNGADVPDAERFAPPGTRLAIRGNPSLNNINTIVLGLRNPADSLSVSPDDYLEDITLWANELRVSGYDEANGWAAIANADIALADLGRIQANIRRQTDGFGALSSTLDEREQDNVQTWGITTDVNLDKFIPERFNWSIPVSFQVQSNTSTPRFAPNRGDVRLEELLTQIDEREDLSEEARAREKDGAIQAAQTYSMARSFTTRIQKQNSRSPFLRYTLDGLSFNYSFSDAKARNPSLRTNDSWRWSSTLSYRLNIPNPHTVRPFWFLDPIPILGVLGDLRFNYLPQSLSLAASATRNFTKTQDRSNVLRDTTTSRVQDLVTYPLREQQTFGHRRNFRLQHNPFSFLNLSFDLNTDQSFNALGVDTLFSVADVLRDTLYDNISLEDALAAGLIDSSQLNQSAFELRQLNVKPAGRVFVDFLQGDPLLRTDQHDQRFTASFRPQLTQIQALNWITLQDVSYSASFDWRNGASNLKTGASIGNQTTINSGISLRIQELFRKFGFYRALEEQEREAAQRAEAERRQREQEKQRRQQEEARQGQGQAPGQTAPEQAPPEETPPGEGDPIDQPDPIEEPNQPAPFDQPDETGEPDQVDQPGEADQPGQTEQTDPETQQTEEGGSGFRPPLPNPASLLRKLALAVTGIRDFNVSYSATRGASSTNVGRPIRDREGNLSDVAVNYSLLDALRGDGAPLGYRFGFTRQLDADQRIFDARLQVSDVLSNSDRITARTALNPSQTLQISVNWDLDWRTGKNITYRPLLDPVTGDPYLDAEGGIIPAVTLTENGSNKASVWAFGASYLDLFTKQLDTFADDVNNAGNPTQVGDENRDGRVVLTNEAVVADFQRAYMKGFSTVDGLGLLPFPMPSWTVNYSGISNWPLLRIVAENATLRHGYSADYATDFTTNSAATSGDTTRSFSLGSRTITYALTPYNVGSIRINERFQPLIGLDVSWKGRLQTNLSWNKSTTHSLSTSNFDVSERNTNELTMTASYQKVGLRLPFLGKPLNNRITFSLTASRSLTDDLRYSLRRALSEAAADPGGYDPAEALAGDNVSVLTSSTRFTLAPQIAYQFSNRVSANFTLRYERFDSEDSRIPSSTTLNGGFNVRVSISN